MITEFNKEYFDVKISMVRIDVENTDRLLEESRFNLNTDNLSKIQINNSINTPYPTLIIEYIDRGNNTVINYPIDGYTLVDLNISNSTSNTKISHPFIVNDIRIIDQNQQQSSIRISATSLTQALLNSYIDYSTGISPKVPTVIANEILKQAKYPISDTQTSNSTASPMDYICPSNYTVYQNIDLLLRYAISSNRGLFYLVFNLVKSTGTILSINDLFNNFTGQKDILLSNQFVIPSKYGTPSQYTSMNEISYGNTLNAINTYNMLGSTTLNNFNYISRTWNKDVIDFKQISNMLPNTPAVLKSTHQKIIKQNPTKISGVKYNREEASASEIKIFDKIDNIFKYYNNIQFSTYGNMIRDVGQLTIVTSNDLVLNKKYGGIWMIVEIYHTFTKEGYINNITLIRVDERKVV